MSRHERAALTWFGTVYRFSSILYPRSFRREFGRQMRDDYSRMAKETLRAGGLGALFALQLRCLADTFRVALRERPRRSRGAPDPSVRPSKRKGSSQGHPQATGRGVDPGSLARDVRQAVRTLRAAPGFATAAVVSLAVGIGANVAIFGFVDAVLLGPLPWPDSDRLVELKKQHPEFDFHGMSLGSAEIVFLRENETTFDALSGYQGDAVVLTGGEEPRRLRGVRVLPGLLEMLGLTPTLGRTFTEGEYVPGDDRVVILSARVWQEEFGADPAAIGTDLTIDGQPYRVIGIMPASAGVPGSRSDLFFPAAMTAEERTDPQSFTTFVTGIGRLPEGATVAAAEDAMSRWIGEFEQRAPDLWSGWRAEATGLRQVIIGDSTVTTFRVLSVAVFAVLLIACANVANLLLARGAARSREIAVRAALGAGRGRIARQLVTESVVLAVIGGGAGVLIAGAVTELLLALSPPTIPRLEDVGIDARVLGFAVLLSVASGVGFGILPAIDAGRSELVSALRDGGRGFSGHRRVRRARACLTMAEVALAVVLLIGTTLMTRTVGSLLSVDPGFDLDDAARVQIALPDYRYPDTSSRLVVLDDIIERVSGVSGVTAAGGAQWLPLSGSWRRSRVNLEASALELDEGLRFVDDDWVAPGYFAAMGIQVRNGRTFSAADDNGVLPVAVVNDTMARLFWPDQQALGKRLTFAEPGPDTEWLTVVGVVADVRSSGFDSEPRPAVYRPISQASAVSAVFEIVVRTAVDPVAVLPMIREAIWAVDPELPIPLAGSLEELLATQLDRPRFILAVLGLMGVVAMVLATVGVYGLVSYLVGRSTREIGVRMALGAGRAHLLRAMLRQGAALVIGGIVLGFLAASLLTGWMSTLLYEVNAADPLTYVLVGAVLTAVGLVATLVPARRAARIDPLIALRYE